MGGLTYIEAAGANKNRNTNNLTWQTRHASGRWSPNSRRNRAPRANPWKHFLLGLRLKLKPFRMPTTSRRIAKLLIIHSEILKVNYAFKSENSFSSIYRLEMAALFSTLINIWVWPSWTDKIGILIRASELDLLAETCKSLEMDQQLECIKQFVMCHLRNVGYDAAICKSQPKDNSRTFPPG